MMKNLLTAFFFVCFVTTLTAGHGARRGEKRPEMDESVMHPKRIYSQHKASFKDPARARTAGSGEGGGDSGMIAETKLRSKVVPAEMEDSEMHPRRPMQKVQLPNPPKIPEFDSDGMHPRPGDATSSLEQAGEAVDNADIDTAISEDFMRRMEIDDSAMHEPRKAVPMQPIRSSFAISRPAEMDERMMHPRRNNKTYKRLTPVDQDIDQNIDNVIDKDFMQRVEVDDSVLHQDNGAKSASGKASYKLTKEDSNEEMHHQRRRPTSEEESEEESGEDSEETDELGIDEVPGADFMKRMEMDDADMHPRSEKATSHESSRMRKSSSRRRLLSFDETDLLKEKTDTLGSLRFGLGYPLHASCKVQWDFGVDCANVSEKLVSQMKAWNGATNCENGGEKCLYKIVFSNSSTLTGTHETPKKHYVDDISFQLNPVTGGGCQVLGFSTSETWYAYLDSGTNYCNLHNLITGSALDKAKGYKETTSDDQCTQYSSADCEKY